MLKGSIVALVTPFTKYGNIDYSELEFLVEQHIRAGTDAIVAVGTTGESTTLTHDEHIDVVRAVTEISAGRIGVIAGNGSNSTAEAVQLTERMGILPIDGFLNVTPYYNKPMPDGLLAHYSACAAASDKPQILYNVPGRTASDMTPDIVERLAEIDNIVGIKEATGDVERVQQLRQRCGESFILLSGDDPTSKDFMLAGGDGVISVTANIAPEQMKALVDAACAGDAERAAAIDKQLVPLHQMLFIESNPIPVKWALALMGWLQANYRLPLTAPTEGHQAEIRRVLERAHLIDVQEQS
ncbi:4-hydroxy-tetrahydrodipicolinate synthase [Idiomarina tyrosinivorans]|uniref:4-hydroxy-tetrahydrodipicolinate synthase n=1 Tax=Idiomarina tyrosinivorans TaxID=1445662 RepID=A0A432ZU42_9GAMM|nr:4-hydroxy-tetrahydrodipicolinate synthase [Idiomarina tyrosinivorans]RUO81464.1 4-hydroxy-tetrahydrodipicolinate synthase [Idiomarina tyrosinivorans]